MKKNEYVAPEMEVVEITEKFGIMQAISEGGVGQNPGPGGENEFD